jgi:hypothetical protein
VCPDQVGRVDGVELDVLKGLPCGRGLEAAYVRQGKVEVPVNKVVGVALGLTTEIDNLWILTGFTVFNKRTKISA